MTNISNYSNVKDYILKYSQKKKYIKNLLRYTETVGDHKYLINDPLWTHLCDFNIPFPIKTPKEVDWDYDLLMRLIFSSTNLLYSFHNIQNNEISLRITVNSRSTNIKVCKYFDELTPQNIFYLTCILLNTEIKDQLTLCKNPYDNSIQKKRKEVTKNFKNHIFHLCLIKNYTKYSISMKEYLCSFPP